MSLELLFPGTVMVLKSLMRLSVDHHIDKVRFARAVFSFPVDVTFLSLSYGAAAMVLIAKSGEGSKTTLEVIGVLFGYLVLGLVMTILCSKVDKAFDTDQDIVSTFGCISAYIVSGGVLLWTIGGGFFV